MERAEEEGRGEEWAGAGGKRTGPWVEVGRAAWAGALVAGLDWLGWVFYFSGFSFSFLFLMQTKLNLFEFKFEFEFNPSTQTNKSMHQHECNNKFKSRKILITCERKIKLNARLSI